MNTPLLSRNVAHDRAKDFVKIRFNVGSAYCPGRCPARCPVRCGCRIPNHHATRLRFGAFRGRGAERGSDNHANYANHPNGGKSGFGFLDSHPKRREPQSDRVRIACGRSVPAHVLAYGQSCGCGDQKH